MNHASEFAKERWAKVSKERKSEQGRLMAKARWANKTKEERSEIMSKVSRGIKLSKKYEDDKKPTGENLPKEDNQTV